MQAHHQHEGEGHGNPERQEQEQRAKDDAEDQRRQGIDETWPVVYAAAAVAREVASGRAARGIVIDAAGIGSTMAANKIAGVRCALCHDDVTVNNAREHNDANMMALGARIRAYAATTPMGPLALVAATPGSYVRARLYMTLASAERPMQLFNDAAPARRWLEAQRDGFAKAVKAGVRLAFGTDSGGYPHGMNAKQFAYQVRLGQTPMEAIRSATSVAAAAR